MTTSLIHTRDEADPRNTAHLVSNDSSEQSFFITSPCGRMSTTSTKATPLNHDDDQACPDMSDTSSSEEEDDDVEQEDTFDMDGCPMPRISSSTIPVYLEVTTRTVGFDTKDPLFGGVCLYSSDSERSQPDELFPNEESSSSTSTTDDGAADGMLSWLLRAPSKLFSSTP
jgi:hypothetical protein